MPWAKKGLANNHKICDISHGHGMEPTIFWGSIYCQGLNDVRGECFHPSLDLYFEQKFSLDPDGWLVRISVDWPLADDKEVAGAERETKTTPSWCEVSCQTKKDWYFLQGEVFFLLTSPLMGDPFIKTDLRAKAFNFSLLARSDPSP